MARTTYPQERGFAYDFHDNTELYMDTETYAMVKHYTHLFIYLLPAALSEAEGLRH
jgi:hypothetical protein